MRSVWNCLKGSSRSFPAHVYAFRHPKYWNWTKIGKNSPRSVKMCEECVSVWRSVWKCMKVSLISFPAQVLAFRHPACLHWLKNCQYSQKCMKSVWRNVRKCVKFSESLRWCPRSLPAKFHSPCINIERFIQLSEGVMDRVREWVNEWVRLPRCRDGHLARGQGPS